MTTKPQVLIVTHSYLPGHNAGGVLTVLAHLVEGLGDEFSFRILTSDRDYRAKEPYDLETGVFHPCGKAEVMYLSPRQQGIRGLSRTIQKIDHDLLLINGIFPR